MRRILRVVMFLVAVLVVVLADAGGTVAVAHGVHDAIGSVTAAPAARTDHREATADRHMAPQGRAACCVGFACCVAGCVTPGILPEAMAIQSLGVAAARIRSFNEPAAGRTVEPPLDPPRRRI